MGTEIEKKYRLPVELRDRVSRRLAEVGAENLGDEFEENTLYRGSQLDQKSAVLRLRRSSTRGAFLTYKLRFKAEGGIKHQREDETPVGDPAAMDCILEGLGFAPAIVYEKRRTTWRYKDVEVVLDELPFGSFMEIEGPEDSIHQAEDVLGLSDLETEHASYPQLTLWLGTQNGSTIEARFPSESKQNEKG
jgi:adenylate cyclase class 2